MRLIIVEHSDTTTEFQLIKDGKGEDRNISTTLATGQIARHTTLSGSQCYRVDVYEHYDYNRATPVHTIRFDCGDNATKARLSATNYALERLQEIQTHAIIKELMI